MGIIATFLSLACDAWDPCFNFMEYFAVRKFATCISSCAEQCSVMWSVLIQPFLFLRDQHSELASLRHHVEMELHALLSFGLRENVAPRTFIEPSDFVQ